MLRRLVEILTLVHNPVCEFHIQPQEKRMVLFNKNNNALLNKGKTLSWEAKSVLVCLFLCNRILMV